ncbi:MAG: hypothetical protein H7126_18010 [Candidatus Parcubacteria bacterium]|uniref:hypothetical protein n=1 Tax=Phormidesmis priestleyi TaxID=268141 RepID=UPI00083B02B4|nr:hypothetical protein [Phormidesmis priestleyi]MBC7825719.1 hypothetical protein [Leptolyngbyaceae cyanobacterium LF-bin-113]
MQLSINHDRLRIDLNAWERILAFFFNQTLEIPLNHIHQATVEKPETDWKEVRLPGTFLPGVIKAGTYYTSRGREFWVVNRDGDCLTLELENEFYKKIVLTIEQSQVWRDRINQQRDLIHQSDLI